MIIDCQCGRVLPDLPEANGSSVVSDEVVAEVGERAEDDGD